MPQCLLDYSQKDHFYDSLTNVAKKFREKEVVAMVEDFNGHFEVSAEDYKDQHWGYTFRARNRKWERVLEFCARMKIRVGNTLFQKKKCYLLA